MTDKTKGIKRVNDITADWVKANFDIEKERRTQHHRLTSSRTDFIVEPGEKGILIEEWLLKIAEWAEGQIEEFDFPKNTNLVIYQDEDHDYYSCDPSTTYYLGVALEAEVPETDAEVITRIKNREKAKVRRRNDKEREKKAKERAIRDEKKLMRQLMKKYADEL